MEDIKRNDIIDFSNQGITEFPRECCFYNDITILNLENNNLTNLPKEIINLKQLRELNLISNNITLNPNQEIWISKLKDNGCKVYIGNKKDEDLLNVESEDWMIKLWDWADDYGISSFIIARNKNKLLSTVTLDFIGQVFEYLPDEITYLSNVTTISLWDVGIKYLPKNIIKLNHLKKLNLRGNPNLIITNTQMKWLNDLSKRSIVFKDNLKCLDDNEFYSEISKYKFNDSGIENEIKEYSEGKWLSSLFEWANLSNIPDNITFGIIRSSDEIKKLKKIDLGLFNLDSLSSSIGNLIQLEELNIESNNLTEIPEEISNLVNLTHLDMSCNNIKILPDSIIDLNKLKILKLRDNSSLILSSTQKEWITNLKNNGCDVDINKSIFQEDNTVQQVENHNKKIEVKQVKDFKHTLQAIEKNTEETLKDANNINSNLYNNEIELNKSCIDSALLSIIDSINEDDLVILFSQEDTILNVVLLAYKKNHYKVVNSIKHNIGYADIIYSIKEWICDELEDLYGLNMLKEEHNLSSDDKFNLNELSIIKSINTYISELSIQSSNEIKLSEIILPDDLKVDITLDFTKEQFADETIDFRKKSLDTVKKLLSNNQLIAKDIAYIIQSGVTSGITTLQESMKSTIGSSIYVSNDKLLINHNIKPIVHEKEQEYAPLEYNINNNTQPIYKLINTYEELENIKKLIYIEYKNMIDKYYNLFEQVEDQLDTNTIDSLEIIGRLLENRQRKIDSAFTRFVPDDSWDITKIQDEFSHILIEIIKDILESTSESISNGLKQNNVYEDIFKIIEDFYKYISIDIHNNPTKKQTQVDIDNLFKDKNLLAIIKNLIGKELVTQDDLESIETLDCKNRGIEFLDGIENLKNIKVLKAASNSKLKDISCLKEMLNLTHVKLGNTAIDDIKPLLELTNLIELSVYNYHDNKDNLDKLIRTFVLNNKSLRLLKINKFKYRREMLNQYM